MATYITLVNFTDQGIRSVKESPNRAEAFKGLAAKLGLEIKGMYWTTGAYDLVTITEGSEEAAMTALLTLGSQGNVRTQVLQAFGADQMKKFIAKMP